MKTVRAIKTPIELYHSFLHVIHYSRRFCCSNAIKLYCNTLQYVLKLKPQHTIDFNDFQNYLCASSRMYYNTCLQRQEVYTTFPCVGHLAAVYEYDPKKSLLIILQSPSRRATETEGYYLF